MFVDLIEFFKSVPNFQQVVLDNYLLGDGIYVIIKNGQIKETLCVKKEQPEHSEYEWLKQADYFSTLVDMNKSVDPDKKIHSCSPFAVFIKTDILPGVGSGEKVLTMEELKNSLQKYYDTLLTPDQQRYDSNALKILEYAQIPEPNIGTVTDCKEWMKAHIAAVLAIAKEQRPAKGMYLKVFFHEDIEKYEQEYRRYLLPKVFNKNDFNIVENDTVYGLSNYNMGMNAKKPYLELMGTRFKVPFRISLEDTMVLKHFFEWITNYRTSSGKGTNYLHIGQEFSFHADINEYAPGYYIHFSKGKETLIKDFDYLPFNFTPREKFYIEDVLETAPDSEDGLIGVKNCRYGDAMNRSQLEQVFDTVFFSKRLIKYYYAEVKDIDSLYTEGEYNKVIQNLLISYRKALHDFFRKRNDQELRYCINALSAGIVRELMKMSSGDDFRKPIAALNLRISMIDRFDLKGDGKMADFVKEMMDKTRAKRDMKEETAVCEDDREFFFVSGQVARYLLSQSEADDIKHSSVESLIRVKDAKILKTKLKDLYYVYGHKLSLNKALRFDNLMSMVMGYESTALLKTYEDYFLTGFLSKNTLWEKVEKIKTEKSQSEHTEKAG